MLMNIIKRPVYYLYYHEIIMNKEAIHANLRVHAEPMPKSANQDKSTASSRKFSDEYDHKYRLLPRQKASRSLDTIETRQHCRSIEEKCNYKLSPDHILFLMEETRLKQLNTLHKQKWLNQYYHCFNNIFMILYQASKIVLNHMFYHKTAQLNFSRLQMVDILIGDFEQDWSEQRIGKLQICCQNIYKLSKDEKEFERRIQFISRKICFNKVKRKSICNCFANRYLKLFWQELTCKTKMYDKYYFIEEMFSHNAEKLCFMDLHRFINRTLCTKPFQEKIEKYCHKEQIDDDLSLDYTFQFLLIEELTFSEDSEDDVPHADQSDKCHIM